MSFVVESAVLAERSLIRTRRNVTIIFWGSLVPILTAVMYATVFGSAIRIEGTRYAEYLIVGVLINATITAATNTAVGISEDLKSGLIDRFRSMPISQASVLLGRIASDVVNLLITLVIMIIPGLLMGWRIRTGVLEALAGFALLVLFGFAAMWIMAFLGVTAKQPEVMANMMYLLLMPVIFLSSAFVPTLGLPAWLRPIADWNPVSAVSTACRHLFGNPAPVSDAWPSQHPILATLAWVVIILAVFVPLTSLKFRKATSN
ncbi:ABC transporter [Enemella evansiae]|uniref:ABC transporter permease n=1 Tax=Enemella evansiae TaxID=2016499 RepID=UPI000B971B07|nr:ABC transporter permease [Enemella evansiae]OYO15504.1 ABC transporter [Enemella evansiae]